MSGIIIKVENLTKKYIIKHNGQNKERYTALRDVLTNEAVKIIQRILSLFRKEKKLNGITKESFLALSDVNFELKTGEILGVVGKNGAGKSTLLKILSRITQPTEGRIEINGRVSSLLEVGTGFHPELTGRENIYLNGAILGMSRNEISDKFNEIVEFAEIEKFIDTPVKRYSSGMYVRLAFSVAAHLDPDILIVDEVLAVGDSAFQKKCLGKMESVVKKDRTVIFVSHNLQAVSQLCTRAILLQDGKLIYDSTPDDVIEKYLKYSEIKLGDNNQIDDLINNLPPDNTFKLNSVQLFQENQMVTNIVQNGKSLSISISYEVLKRATGLRVFFDLCDSEGLLLFRSFNDEKNNGIPTAEPGVYSSTATIPANILGPIQYQIRIHAAIHNVRSCLPLTGLLLPIEVTQTGDYNMSYLDDTFRGKLGFSLSWLNKRV